MSVDLDIRSVRAPFVQTNFQNGGIAPMPRIIVLFNLKPDADAAEYESWSMSKDAPTVRGLSSVEGFTVHRATGLLGSEAPAPYAYVEVLDVSSMDGLIQDISTDVMQSIAAEFQRFAADPQFIVTEFLA